MSDRSDRDPPDPDAPDPDAPDPDAPDPDGAAPDEARNVTAEMLALLDPDPIVADALFDKLVTDVSGWLERRSCHDADGVAGEAVLRMLKKALRGEVDARESGFRRLVFRAAWRVAQEGWRRERRAPQLEGAHLPPTSVGPVEQRIVETTLRLEHASRLLPPDEWKLLSRYYTDDDEHEAQARELGITPGALRVRVHRVKKKLQTLLRRKGDPPTPPPPAQPRPTGPKKT